MSAVESNFEGLVSTLVPLGVLSPQNQAEILDQSEVLNFERGAFVFNEGDTDPYSFYLLEGRLELLSGGQTIQRLVGGSDDAVHALAQLQPRKMSARAESAVSVLRIDRALLDKMRTDQAEQERRAFQVAEIDSEEDDDWMTRMLQSKLFSNLPASNIHRIFSRMETITAAQGDVIVKQDADGDFYYVVVRGRAEITRASGPSASGYRLALIGPGDAFGEEALVGGGPRNATVTMLTDGELVRLSNEDFSNLIKKPLLSAVSLSAGRDIEATRGAVWLDVRFPEQHAANALKNSINHPLNTLRMHSGRLDSSKTYLVYCDDGSLSCVAAFLLAERGFDVHFLEGGLVAYSEASPVPASDGDVDLSLSEDDTTADADRPAPAPAPVPSSHKSAKESPQDPATEAAALSVKLGINELRLAESSDSAAHASAAQASAARAEEERLSRERAIQAATLAARKAAQEQAEKQIKAAQAKAKAELARARKLAEQVAEQKLESKRREKAVLAAAEAARKAAQDEAEKQIAAERAKINAELLDARKQIEQEAEQRHQAERHEAERREEEIRAETEAARKAAQGEAEKQIALEREKASAELQRAREEAAREAQQKLEAELAERGKLEQAAEQAQRELSEARRLKEELEQARAEAERQVEREREEQALRVEQVRAEMERRLQDEEAKLRESYAWQAEELQRLKQQKVEAEARLRDEQERVEKQSAQARAQLAQARDYQNRLEQVEQASAAEAALRERQEIELKRRLREELNQKVQSERAALEQELARNAVELQRARRERDAAEAARIAAADEAQKVVTEFKAAHARKRMQEEADMRVERERLELESKRLRLALELAQREKDAAQEKRERIEAEIESLRRETPQLDSDTREDLEKLEAAANLAAEEVARTEKARADVQAQAVASAGNLAAHQVHVEQARADLKHELDAWISEQSDLENSAEQREVLANQKAHIERIKQRAEAARKAAKDHDQSLIDELAEHLQGSDAD